MGGGVVVQTAWQLHNPLTVTESAPSNPSPTTIVSLKFRDLSPLSDFSSLHRLGVGLLPPISSPGSTLAVSPAPRVAGASLPFAILASPG